MVERRAEVVARLKSLEEGAAPLVAFLQNPAAVQELRADKQYNLQMLNERYQVYPSFLFLNQLLIIDYSFKVKFLFLFFNSINLFIYSSWVVLDCIVFLCSVIDIVII